MTDSTRREFVRGAARLLAGGAAAAAAAPLLEACDTPDPTRSWTFRASIDVSSLTTDGAAVITKTAGEDGAPILVVRTAPDTFSALSTQCAHEGCPVNPPVGGIITCPCHGSQYKLDGSVVRGPTVYPLTRYLTHYDPKARTLMVGLTE